MKANVNIETRAQRLQPAEIEVGDSIPPLTKSPTEIQLFRFSAVTWNSHRVHFDAPYSQNIEGHPGTLVQAHLHGAFLVQFVMDWAGPKARLLRFGWKNRGRSVPGDILTCTGVVTHKTVKTGSCELGVEFTETNQAEQLCASGSAVVSLPTDSALP